jgi:hypothetical protein
MVHRVRALLAFGVVGAGHSADHLVAVATAGENGVATPPARNADFPVGEPAGWKTGDTPHWFKAGEQARKEHGASDVLWPMVFHRGIEVFAKRECPESPSPECNSKCCCDPAPTGAPWTRGLGRVAFVVAE